jgi:hypothetical protein
MRAALLLLALAAPAQATCENEGALFSCQIGKKTLQICQADQTLTYTFGPAKAPELVIAEPLETVDYEPWSGWGRNRFYTVTFQNDGFDYEVWSGFDRIGQPRGMDGGVIVRKGGAQVVELTCDWGSTTGELDVIGSLKNKIGQCYDQEVSTWRSGPCGTNPEFCAC